MPLTKSIPLKAGTPVLMKSTRTDETLFEYTVPDKYNAVMHIVVDLYQKPSPLDLPGQNPPGGKH